MLYEEIDGWRCVVVVSSDSRLHLNQNAVDGVKISDDDINLMRSDVYYNFKVLANDFDGVKNQWLDYPHIQYLTNAYEFNSVERAVNILYSNLISLDLDSNPMAIHQKMGSISFGCGDCGDTFFSYGSSELIFNGLFQSFSGSGSGSIWVR